MNFTEIQVKMLQEIADERYYEKIVKDKPSDKEIDPMNYFVGDDFEEDAREYASAIKHQYIDSLEPKVEEIINQVFLNHIRLVNEENSRPVFSLWGLPADVIREIVNDLITKLESDKGEKG